MRYGEYLNMHIKYIKIAANVYSVGWLQLAWAVTREISPVTEGE